MPCTVHVHVKSAEACKIYFARPLGVGRPEEFKSSWRYGGTGAKARPDSEREHTANSRSLADVKNAQTTGDRKHGKRFSGVLPSLCGRCGGGSWCPRHQLGCH